MSPKEIKSVIVSCCLICLGLTLAGCRASEAQETQEGEAEMAIQITSSAFSEGEAIPKKHTCSGEDVSPPLAWSGTPQAAKSLAIIMDDPDAPGKTFVHWVLFNIPPGTVELAEGARGAGVAGVNDFRRTGYNGPCPPGGADAPLFLQDLRPGSGIEALRRRQQGGRREGDERAHPRLRAMDGEIQQVALNRHSPPKRAATHVRGQSVSRILSSRSLDDHLSGTHVAMRLLQPTQDFDLRTGREASSLLSLLGLAPGGGCLAACITAGAGGLLHERRRQAFATFSPLPASQSDAVAVCFCGPIRQVAPSRVLPGTALYGVRTFLDPAKQSRDHPTDPGQRDDNRFVLRSQPALERLGILPQAVFLFCGRLTRCMLRVKPNDCHVPIRFDDQPVGAAGARRRCNIAGATQRDSCGNGCRTPGYREPNGNIVRDSAVSRRRAGVAGQRTRARNATSGGFQLSRAALRLCG